MKIHTNYADLNKRIQEINLFRSTFPTIAAMIGGRIESFYMQNRPFIITLEQKKEQIRNAYIACDEKGEYMSEKNQAGDSEYVFISPEHKEAFHKELTELGDKPCTLII